MCYRCFHLTSFVCPCVRKHLAGFSLTSLLSLFYVLPSFRVTDAKINHYLKLMQRQYILHWQLTLQHSKKLEFYNTFKTEFEYTLSYYLDFTKKKITNRKALVKLRIGNHKLMIESGRYDQIPRENRLCPSCRSNEIEDETLPVSNSLNILFKETNISIKCSSMFTISNNYLQ